MPPIVFPRELAARQATQVLEQAAAQESSVALRVERQRSLDGLLDGFEFGGGGQEFPDPACALRIKAREVNLE